MDPLARARTMLLGSAMILLAIGVIMIYSASAIKAFESMNDSTYFIKRHLLYLFFGMGLAYYMSSVSIEKMRSHSKKIFIIGVVLLVLVLIPHVGYKAHGARRWFRFFGAQFQPSEFFKIAILLYMADFLDRKKASLKDFRHTLLPALVILGVSAGLLMKEPDLGTAFTLVVMVLILFFAAGLDLRYIGLIAAAGIPALALAVITKPYRIKRMLAFLNPWEDPRGIGFQITQSFIALGSGGLFGVGLGRSQQKLFYLPAAHTDFIFSIIGEELGFVGASAVVLLFAVFIFAGMVIVVHARDGFRQLLGLGLVSLIGMESVINIGVSIGALPTKGLSLPFVSYGGSALLLNMAALGILLNLSRETPPPPAGGGIEENP